MHQTRFDVSIFCLRCGVRMYGVAIGLRDRSNPFTRNLFGNLSLTSPTRVKCSATAFSTTSTPIETTPWPVWHPLRSRCLGDRPISPFEQDVRTWPGAKSPEALVACREHGQQALVNSGRRISKQNAARSTCKAWHARGRGRRGWIQTFRRRQVRSSHCKSPGRQSPAGFDRWNGGPTRHVAIEFAGSCFLESGRLAHLQFQPGLLFCL